MNTVSDKRREGAVVVSTGKKVYTGQITRVNHSHLEIHHPRAITPVAIPLSAIKAVRPLAAGEKL